MSPIWLTAGRVFGRARTAFTNALLTPVFCVCAAGLFACDLFAAEGTRQAPGLLWSVSVSPILPFLAVFLGMNTWSDEIHSGRIEEMLSVAVPERDYVMGKFLGVLLLTLRDLLLSLALTLLTLYFFNAKLVLDYSLSAFGAGFFILVLQAVLWSAVSVSSSAWTGSAALSAVISLCLAVLMPRCGWFALQACAPQGSLRFGPMPLDAHVVDFVTGHVPLSALAFYILAALAALYICTNRICERRYIGVANRPRRWAVRGLSVLSLAVATLAWMLVARFGLVLELPAEIGSGERFSARTRHIMGESQGEIRAVVFASRKNPGFRTSAGLIRAFARETAALGGAHILVRYVDPFWDPAAASRLVNAGVAEDSIVFEKGNRRETVPLDAGFGEQACALAVQRLTLPSRSRSVYWTTGHKECSLVDYGAWGLSSIARAVVMEGYRNQTLDLSDNKPIPEDCALIVVAGARTEFSRLEGSRLESYLRQGGRLLVLLASDRGGLSSMLPAWGIRPKAVRAAPKNSLTGTDRVVSGFGNHAIVNPLEGERLVFDSSIALEPSVESTRILGTGPVAFVDLCRADGVCLAALSEYGSAPGADVAARPARLIVVGDVGFVQNARLENSVSANREFFLNCISYLAGVDALAETGVAADQLVVGLDRSGRMRFVLVSAVVLPGACGLVLLLRALVGRRRK